MGERRVSPRAAGDRWQPPAGDRSPLDWRSQVLEANTEPQRVPRFYDRVAPVYDAWTRAFESRAFARLLEVAAVRDGEAVLEVAVGPGRQLVELLRRNPSGRTVGVELSKGMLAAARRRVAKAGVGGVELMHGSALDLPFEEGSFDLVCNSYMLDLLPREDIPRALGEFQRVLRPGGRLVLSNMTKGERARHRFWDALYARRLPLSANCRGVLAAPVLDELGFLDIRREYRSQLSFPTEIVWARRAP